MAFEKSDMHLKEPVDFSIIDLGIVCPMANEEDSVFDFVAGTLNTCRPLGFRSLSFFAILDRVSTDRTRDILSSMRRDFPELNIIYAPENRCVVDAYLRGYREALTSGSQWVLEIDAGLSHRSEDIPPFLVEMSRNDLDCVFATRFSHGGSIEQSTFSRFLISKGGTLLANLLLRTRLHDMTSGFQLFKAGALKKILAQGIFSQGPFFQTEMKVYAHRLNMRFAELPIVYRFASHQVGRRALSDAIRQLWRLYRRH